MPNPLAGRDTKWSRRLGVELEDRKSWSGWNLEDNKDSFRLEDRRKV